MKDFFNKIKRFLNKIDPKFIICCLVFLFITYAIWQGNRYYNLKQENKSLESIIEHFPEIEESYPEDTTCLFIDEMSPKDIYYSLIREGIKYPEIVMAQAICETGHFKSNLYKKHHNLFGMMYPRTRWTTACGGTESGFAIFRTDYDAIIDYAVYQSVFMRGCNTEIEYLNKLQDNGYFHNPQYKDYIISIRNNLDKYING